MNSTKKTIKMVLENDRTIEVVKTLPNYLWVDLEYNVQLGWYDVLEDYIYDIDVDKIKSVEIEDSTDLLRLNEINSNGFRKFTVNEVLSYV